MIFIRMQKRVKTLTESSSALSPGQRLPLPQARRDSSTSIEAVLSARRSVRDYAPAPLTVADVSQLLWAAQGVSGTGGLRTAPSACAIYPLRTYLLAGAVKSLPSGIYGYDPDAHELECLSRGDRRAGLFEACGEQVCASECAVAVLLTGWFTRALRELGPKAPDLARIEAGHAGQNFLLQACALGLGGVGLGKYDPEAIKQVFTVPTNQVPLYILLAGKPETL